MPRKYYVFFTGLLTFLFSLTAPFAVPIAMLLTRRDANNLAWSWYDTPDEPELMDTTFPSMKDFYDKWGWYIAGCYWFGWRNRGHGFESLFAEEAPGHWDTVDDLETDYVRGDYFLYRKRYGDFVFVYGWQVYRSKKFATGFEYRPKLAIKRRPVK